MSKHGQWARYACGEKRLEKHSLGAGSKIARCSQGYGCDALPGHVLVLGPNLWAEMTSIDPCGLSIVVLGTGAEIPRSDRCKHEWLSLIRTKSLANLCTIEKPPG